MGPFVLLPGLEGTICPIAWPTGDHMSYCLAYRGPSVLLPCLEGTICPTALFNLRANFAVKNKKMHLYIMIVQISKLEVLARTVKDRKLSLL